MAEGGIADEEMAKGGTAKGVRGGIAQEERVMVGIKAVVGEARAEEAVGEATVEEAMTTEAAVQGTTETETIRNSNQE